MIRPRSIAWLIGGLALALLVVVLGTWSSYRQFLATPLEVAEPPARLEVAPGDSVRTVVARLEAQGLTRSDWRWRLLLRLRPVTIQVGEYHIEAGLTPVGLLEQLASGDVIQYRFTIVEGWSWRQLAAALLREEVLAVEAGWLGADEIMGLLGSAVAGPEGWFLPETYVYERGDSALDLLRRAHAAMREALDEAWSVRAVGLPFARPEELLTMASIVEKETSLAAERAAIAGVFVRRLQARWRLETDPTVIYGLGAAWDGDIRSRDLRTDTPYNTYTRHGLPPTPIAMPGRQALLASAQPAPGTAMFFVADGTGGHVFSDTLEQHNKAVQDMLKRARQGAGQ